MKKLLFISCLTLFACTVPKTTTPATQTQHNLNPDWVANEKLADHIIAIGISEAEIPNFADAMVLVGEKHAYLAQSDVGAPNWRQILQQVETQYLTLTSSNQRHREIGNTYIEVLSGEDSGNLRVQFLFSKPKTAFRNAAEMKQEEQKMRDLMFQCTPMEYATVASLNCFQYANMDIRSAQINNRSALAHTFGTPIPIKIAYHESEYTTSSHQKLSWLNGKLRFNVRTFPIKANIITP